jgi:hypothetical protein
VRNKPALVCGSDGEAMAYQFGVNEKKNSKAPLGRGEKVEKLTLGKLPEPPLMTPRDIYVYKVHRVYIINDIQ